MANYQISFDKVALVYDLLAKIAFGKKIKKAQHHYLSLIPDNSHVLIIGGGTGWILTDILSLKKNIQHITYLEASVAMLDQTRQKLTIYKASHTDLHFPTITLIHGTEDDIPTGNDYDVIITNFFLDVFQETELQAVMQKLLISLKTNGIWLFSDFNISKKPMNGWWQGLWIKSMYWFFKITCNLNAIHLPDFAKHFYELGFTQTHSQYFFHEMMVAKVYRNANRL